MDKGHHVLFLEIYTLLTQCPGSLKKASTPAAKSLDMSWRAKQVGTKWEPFLLPSNPQSSPPPPLDLARFSSLLVSRGSVGRAVAQGRAGASCYGNPGRLYESISASGQLPTYPSPNPTLTLTCSQVTVVELGEGKVVS